MSAGPSRLPAPVTPEVTGLRAAARKEVVHLPLPRLVKAELRLQRRAEPAALAIVDDVPVALPSLRGSEAPVALRLPAKGGFRAQSWRVVDGTFYRPFLCHVDVGATPAEASARIVARMRHQVGIRGQGSDASHQGSERLVDAAAVVEGADRAHEVARLEGRPVRRVVEDGLARRPDDLETVTKNLVLVDGRLHHRAPAPAYLVRGADGDAGMLRVTADDPYLAVPGGLSTPRSPWCAFAPDALGEVEAFLEAIPDRDWFPHRRDTSPAREFAVTDPGALASACAPPRLDAFVAASLDAYLALCGPQVHRHSDEVVAAYLDARLARGALAEGGDPEAVFERLRRLVLALDDATAANAEGFPVPFAVAGRCLLLRHDLIERPRHGLDPIAPPDEAALSALSPGSAP